VIAFRLLVALAGLMGAAGVGLAAAAAHQADAARLGPASTMLLFHAAAVIGAVLLTERRIVHPVPGLAAAIGLAAGALLFASDLTLRQFVGHGLFPMAAPSGGSLLIASWLLLALAALWPRRQ
jgi:uncharacterized membrane protein YgdD (TMEM256/DUF423 family)